MIELPAIVAQIAEQSIVAALWHRRTACAPAARDRGDSTTNIDPSAKTSYTHLTLQVFYSQESQEHER